MNLTSTAKRAKRRYKLWALAVILLGVGSSIFLANSKSSPKDVGKDFITLAGNRDYNAVLSLVLPELVDYYERENKLRYLAAYINVYVNHIPYNSSASDITEIKVLERNAFIKNVGDSFLLQYIPEGIDKDVFVIKIYYENEGAVSGTVFYVTKKAGKHYLVVPDMSETAVWRWSLE